MEQRIVIDISKELWCRASVEAAKKGITKKQFLQDALMDKIEREESAGVHGD